MKKKPNKSTRAKPSSPSRGASAGSEVIDLVPSILKLKTILVPIDFSDVSKRALDYALLFGQQFGAKIHLLHVIEPYLYPVEPEFAPLVVDNRALIEASQQKLNQIGKKNVVPSLLGTTTVRTGKAFKEIVDAAKKMKADLIIITTHGYTGLEHVFLGSTAERVVRYAPCPVLAIRHPKHAFL